MPTTVALVERDNGDLVLIDAGLSRLELAEPWRLGPFHGALFRPSGRPFGRGSPAVAAADQIAALGFDPDRVVAIVATHLHLDHIGAFVDFPNAEVVCTAAEFARARQEGWRRGYRHVDAILRSGRARPVSLVRESRHGFPRHLDLFNDGRVLLLDARGHTAGSVAALLHEPEPKRTCLMAGDAAYTRAEYREARMSWLTRVNAFNREWVRATWGRLHAFEVESLGVPVVPAHCHEAWQQVCGHGS